jgi:hypothetical protein
VRAKRNAKVESHYLPRDVLSHGGHAGAILARDEKMVGAAAALARGAAAAAAGSSAAGTGAAAVLTYARALILLYGGDRRELVL